MQTLSIDAMQDLGGAGFWSGVACGAGIVGSVAATVSPEPLSKLTLWGIYSGTAAACGMAFS